MQSFEVILVVWYFYYDIKVGFGTRFLTYCIGILHILNSPEAEAIL